MKMLFQTFTVTNFTFCLFVLTCVYQEKKFPVLGWDHVSDLAIEEYYIWLESIQIMDIFRTSKMLFK